jgi:hypothetical protein
LANGALGIAFIDKKQTSEVLMKKVWRLVQDIVLCWLPFAFALSLSHSTLSHMVRADLRDWEPAFYSFFPMCFFFTGLASFLNRLEIRKLRDTVGLLGASSK